MIKIDKGHMEIRGKGSTLVAEMASGVRNLIEEMAKGDLQDGINCFKIIGNAVADAGEDLVKNYDVDIDELNSPLEPIDKKKDKKKAKADIPALWRKFRDEEIDVDEFIEACGDASPGAILAAVATAVMEEAEDFDDGKED